MTDTPILRRALAGVISLCLLAGMGIALVAGEDDEPERVDRVTAVDGEGPGREVTIAPPQPGAPGVPDQPGAPPPLAAVTATSGGGPTTAPAAPAATTPSPTTAPDAAPAAEGLGTPTDPGPASPPAAGTYRYKGTKNGQPSDATTVVEDVSRSPSETRQLITQEDADSKIRSEVGWLSDRVTVYRSTIFFGQTPGDCDWNPDITEVLLPMKEGLTWKNDTGCSAMFGAMPVTIKFRTEATVKGLERLRIAGEVIDVWRIESTQRIEYSSTQGSGVSEGTLTSWVSPRHGMVVKLIESATGPGGREDTARELQSLKPE